MTQFENMQAEEGASMIIMTILVKAKAGKGDEFLQAMHSLNTGSIVEKGLKASTLYEEMDDQASFRLIEEWESQEALDAFLNHERFRVLSGAIKVLCLYSEIRYSRSAEIPEYLQEIDRMPQESILPMVEAQNTNKG